MRISARDISSGFFPRPRDEVYARWVRLDGLVSPDATAPLRLWRRYGIGANRMVGVYTDAETHGLVALELITTYGETDLVRIHYRGDDPALLAGAVNQVFDEIRRDWPIIGGRRHRELREFAVSVEDARRALAWSSRR